MAEVLRVSGELEMAEVSLAIAFLTSRKEPHFDWFCDSLAKQIVLPSQTILVDFYANEEGRKERMFEQYAKAFCVPLKIEHDEKGNMPSKFFIHTEPKPTIWQGRYKITRDSWWAKSNAANTSICLCSTDCIAMCDDRCVLSSGWINSVVEAQLGNYAVCGSYEKRANMKVENGEIIDYGECLGIDTRHQYGEPVATKDWYGGSCALPLEWCLAVNGFSEDLCDSLGSEDSMFGVTLRNSGYPMKFDSRMRIIEDRTPSEIDGALKRADKNPHLGQKAKSWDIVRAFHGKTTSQNSFDIRDMRARILNGEDWRPPSASHFDWYDGAPVAEME